MRVTIAVCDEESYNERPTFDDVFTDTEDFAEDYTPKDFLLDNVRNLLDIEEVGDDEYRVAYIDADGCETAQYFKFSYEKEVQHV